jgi:metal-responsive CopG/Arc/MetJ family transcriptional regulator
MATEMITLKLEETFLSEIDSVVARQGYQNRTEFIRIALREKIEETKYRAALLQLSRLKGASKRGTTDKELEQVREKVFWDIERKLR